VCSEGYGGQKRRQGAPALKAAFALPATQKGTSFPRCPSVQNNRDRRIRIEATWVTFTPMVRL